MKTFYKLYFFVGLVAIIIWIFKLSTGTGDYSSFVNGAAIGAWLVDMIDNWRVE